MRRPWIKIEVATPDKPEICAIANRLKMDEDMVVGKLVRFWAWVAQNQVSGSNLGVTLDFIDRLVSRKGFAAALCQAGWLVEVDGVVSIPNFDRHNSNLARTRALTKTRVERHRKVTPQKEKKRSSKVTKVTAEPEPIIEDHVEEQAEKAQESPAPVIPIKAVVEASTDPQAAAEELVEAPEEGETNDELSINALPTFNALQSESVVEKVMDAVPEGPPDVEPPEPQKPSKKKEVLFDDQPMLF